MGAEPSRLVVLCSAEEKLEGTWQRWVAGGPGSDVPAPLSCHTQDCTAKLKKAFLELPPQNATENISGK